MDLDKWPKKKARPLCGGETNQVRYIGISFKAMLPTQYSSKPAGHILKDCQL